MDTLAPYHDRLLREGRLVVLCDALNEMPRAAGQLDALITYLKLKDTPTPRYVISCRVRDYQADDAPLAPLRPLEQVLLRDLELPAIRELVVKRLGDQVGGALWMRMGGTPKLMDFWEKVNQKQATDLFWEKNTAWWNNEQRLGERIWSEPDAWRTMHRDGARLIPLCRNPYMGHLLCAVYDKSHELPDSRAKLFGDFVDKMLLRERNAAERRGQPFPHSDAITSALVAFARELQTQKITVLPQAEAQKLVSDPALLRAATDANILAAEGDNLKFAHQLLQEYFAAKILLEAMEAKPQRSPAEFFGETWWDAGVWAETVVILGEFPGGRDSANRATQWLAPVTPEVALEVITRNAAGLTLDDLTPETKQVLIQGSCSVSDYDLKNLKWGTRKTDPRGRAAAWRVLGHLRADPRPGVLNFDWGEDYWRKAPAGPFIMGSDQDNDNPKREATIDYDFWIGKYPITWAQFKAFLDDPDGYEKDAWWAGLHPDALKHRNKNQIQRWKIANHPAEQVSWYDAMAFCAWLNGKVKPPLPDGAPADCRIRLPLETEWEKAAAWDAQRQKALVYPYGDAFDPLKGNTYEGRVGRTTAVGLYPHAPSPAGGLDMSGNIWEWCLNEYESGDENISFNQRRGVRGGAWGGGQVWARAAYRLNGYPDPRDVFLGFRVVVAVPVSH
jgi:formylglycine-generating enzyme required for sulfatase activity